MSLSKLQGGIGTGGGATFRGRIQWDARAGRMSIINRKQTALGWENSPELLTEPFALAMDIANIEMIWMRVINGVDIQAVKARDIIAGDAVWPARPSEDHKEGFRVAVANAKLFDGVREWASTALCVRSAIDDLHDQWHAQENRDDDVPIVTFSGAKAQATAKGTNYGPVLAITDWKSRDIFDADIPTASMEPTPRTPPAKASAPTIPAPHNARQPEVEFA